MFDFNDVPPENTIVVPADEVSAQWGKFPPGMTAAPWQADWFYITGNKKEAEHIESFGLPAVCHKGLGPEHLRGADVALLNCDGAALVDMLASIVRQLRVLNVPNLASCNKEQFIHLTKPHWERRSEAAQKFLDAFDESTSLSAATPKEAHNDSEAPPKPKKATTRRGTPLSTAKSSDIPYTGPVVNVSHHPTMMASDYWRRSSPTQRLRNSSNQRDKYRPSLHPVSRRTTIRNTRARRKHPPPTRRGIKALSQKRVHRHHLRLHQSRTAAVSVIRKTH